MTEKRIKGRAIFAGNVSGAVLKSEVPVGFFGHLEPDEGVYKEKGHPLDGASVKDRILVFPRAKGSTVGSYIIYGLKKAGNAPAAMIMTECDTIVAVGSIIGEVPTIDSVDISGLKDGSQLKVEGEEVIVDEG